MRYVLGLALALLCGTAAMAQSGPTTAQTGSNATGVKPTDDMTGQNAGTRTGKPSGKTQSKKAARPKKM